MMMTAFCVALLHAGLARADDSIAWDFADSAGVRLDDTESSGTFRESWDENFENSGTTGDGAYALRRGTGTTTNSFVEVDDAQQVTLIYVIRGWQFKGDPANETIRLGLVHKTDDTKPYVLCQFKLSRTDEETVTLTAEAFGDGATNVSDSLSFAAGRATPLTLILKYDPESKIYEAWTVDGEAQPNKLGQASTDPDREPRYLRIGATGSLMVSDDSEFFEIDRIEYGSVD